MRRSNRAFLNSLDMIAPRQPNPANALIGTRLRQVRRFFGSELTSKRAILDWVNTFPQLKDAVPNYRAWIDEAPGTWDVALVQWISALANEDYEYADKIRAHASSRGVQLSRFPGNIFMRTP